MGIMAASGIRIQVCVFSVRDAEQLKFDDGELFASQPRALQSLKLLKDKELALSSSSRAAQNLSYPL